MSTLSAGNRSSCFLSCRRSHIPSRLARVVGNPLSLKIMAPVTRSSTRSSLTLAPKSSSTPAPSKKRRGASQARASESQSEQVVWYGGENADQDVCIRLVRDTVNEVDRTLARLMVHSSRLETCSSYFAAALSQRWTTKRKRSPQELTIHVQGDIRLYTDCFSRMYKPFMVGFKSVEYSLQLLAVATHLACDDLMSSICLYLASVCPWSEKDEMRIRSSVLSEDFPRGHAQDLLERLESRLTRDDLRPLISRCIERSMCSLSRGSSVESRMQGMCSLSFRSSLESGMQAWELLDHLLSTARGQERSLTPTFEHEAVCIINEEFKLLLVAGNVEAEAADSMEDNPGLVNTVYRIQQVLDFLLPGMADEAVKCFAQYASFPKLIGDAVRSEFYDDEDVMIVVDKITWTVVSILSDLVSGDLHAEESVQDALLLNWLPLLDWLHQNADEALGLHKTEYCEEYRQVKEALLFMRPSSQQLKEIIDKVLVA